MENNVTQCELKATCKQCGNYFSTNFAVTKKKKFVAQKEGFCSRKCRCKARRATKHLHYVLRENPVPCPDCKQIMKLGMFGIYSHDYHLALKCENPDCNVIMIESNRVIRDSTAKIKTDPKEVDGIINKFMCIQELYDSSNIIYYQPGQPPYPKLTSLLTPQQVYYKQEYLTDKQQNNFLKMFALNGELLISTWEERRKNLEELELAKKLLCKIKTLADVEIGIDDIEEGMPQGNCLLFFDRAVKAVELTKGERIQIAAYLLKDIEKN